jgi:hypothetical protein
LRLATPFDRALHYAHPFDPGARSGAVRSAVLARRLPGMAAEMTSEVRLVVETGAQRDTT